MLAKIIEKLSKDVVKSELVRKVQKEEPFETFTKNFWAWGSGKVKYKIDKGSEDFKEKIEILKKLLASDKYSWLEGKFSYNSDFGYRDTTTEPTVLEISLDSTELRDVNRRINLLTHFEETTFYYDFQKEDQRYQNGEVIAKLKMIRGFNEIKIFANLNAKIYEPAHCYGDLEFVRKTCDSWSTIDANLYFKGKKDIKNKFYLLIIPKTLITSCFI